MFMEYGKLAYVIDSIKYLLIMSDKTFFYVFIPIYLIEISISSIALVKTLKDRSSIRNKSLYERMIINIMIADLIFNVVHFV